MFNVTKPTAAGKSNPTLERVARFVNLLGADGVRPRAGDLVAIIHDAATPSVMKDEAFKAKYGSANPNLAVIAALRKAGVEVHVLAKRWLEIGSREAMYTHWSRSTLRLSPPSPTCNFAATR